MGRGSALTKSIYALIFIVIASVFSVTRFSVTRFQSNQNASSASNRNVVEPRKIVANGEIQGRTRELNLRFEVSGRLASVRVREGDQVQCDEVLASIDDTAAKYELARCESEVMIACAERERIINGASRETRDAASAELTAAEAFEKQLGLEKRRLVLLSPSGAASRQELEQIQYRHEHAAAMVKLARARLAEVDSAVRNDELAIHDARVSSRRVAVFAAMNSLDKCKLRAPNCGTVLKVYAERGDMIGPETGDSPPVVVMSDDSEFFVRAYVEELDAGDVRTGMAAIVTSDGLPYLKMAGKVESCSGIMVEKRNHHNRPSERSDVKVREVTIKVGELEKVDREKLVVGMPVEVTISR